MRKAKFTVTGGTEEERDAFPGELSEVIKLRGHDKTKLYAAMGCPGGQCPSAYEPLRTVYEDFEAQKPLCFLVQDTGPEADDRRRTVLTADFQVLGFINAPAEPGRVTSSWEIQIPKGETLVGKMSKVAWTVVLILSPLYLAWNLALFFSDAAGDVKWPIPHRAVWKPTGIRRLTFTALKYSGITERYIYRPARIDARLAYAQIVADIR